MIFKQSLPTGCDTEVVRLEGTSTTPTTADLVAVMNYTNSWKTFRVTAVSSDPTGGSITWNFLPGEEHFMFYIFGGMLTPATKQTITVHLADGVDASSGAVVDNDSKTVTKTFCTREKPFFNHFVFDSTQLAFLF